MERAKKAENQATPFCSGGYPKYLAQNKGEEGGGGGGNRDNRSRDRPPLLFPNLNLQHKLYYSEANRQDLRRETFYKQEITDAL